MAKSNFIIRLVLDFHRLSGTDRWKNFPLRPTASHSSDNLRISGEHLPSWPARRTLVFVVLEPGAGFLFFELHLSRRTAGMIDQRMSSRAKPTATARGHS